MSDHGIDLGDTQLPSYAAVTAEHAITDRLALRRLRKYKYLTYIGWALFVITAIWFGSWAYYNTRAFEQRMDFVSSGRASPSPTGGVPASWVAAHPGELPPMYNFTRRSVQNIQDTRTFVQYRCITGFTPGQMAKGLEWMGKQFGYPDRDLVGKNCDDVDPIGKSNKQIEEWNFHACDSC